MLLNDTELREGIIGATGFIVLKIFMDYIDMNPRFELFVAWATVWYFRKISLNIYKSKIKKRREMIKLSTKMD